MAAVNAPPAASGAAEPLSKGLHAGLYWSWEPPIYANDPRQSQHITSMSQRLPNHYNSQSLPLDRHPTLLDCLKSDPVVPYRCLERNGQFKLEDFPHNAGSSAACLHIKDARERWVIGMTAEVMKDSRIWNFYPDMEKMLEKAKNLCPSSNTVAQHLSFKAPPTLSHEVEECLRKSECLVGAHQPGMPANTIQLRRLQCKLPGVPVMLPDGVQVSFMTHPGDLLGQYVVLDVFRAGVPVEWWYHPSYEGQYGFRLKKKERPRNFWKDAAASAIEPILQQCIAQGLTRHDASASLQATLERLKFHNWDPNETPVVLKRPEPITKPQASRPAAAPAPPTSGNPHTAASSSRMLEADHSYTPGSGSFHPGGSYAAPAGGYQQAAPYQHDLAYTVQQHAAAGHSMQQQLAAAGGYDSAPGHHQYAHMHPHEPQGYHQHSASPVRTAFRPVTPSDAHAQGKLQQQLPQPHQQPVSQQQQLSQLQHPQQQQQQLLPQQQQHFPSQQCSQQSAPESDYMQHRAQQPPAASPTAEPATAGTDRAGGKRKRAHYRSSDHAMEALKRVHASLMHLQEHGGTSCTRELQQKLVAWLEPAAQHMQHLIAAPDLGADDGSEQQPHEAASHAGEAEVEEQQQQQQQQQQQAWQLHHPEGGSQAEAMQQPPRRMDAGVIEPAMTLALLRKQPNAASGSPERTQNPQAARRVVTASLPPPIGAHDMI